MLTITRWYRARHILIFKRSATCGIGSAWANETEGHPTIPAGQRSAPTPCSAHIGCKQCGHRVTEYSRKIGTSVCGIVTPKESPKRIRPTLWIGVVEIDRAVVGIGTNSCPDGGVRLAVPPDSAGTPSGALNNPNGDGAYCVAPLQPTRSPSQNGGKCASRQSTRTANGAE